MRTSTVDQAFEKGPHASQSTSSKLETDEETFVHSIAYHCATLLDSSSPRETEIGADSR